MVIRIRKNSKDISGKNESGMTLLEVLASLSLLAFILGVMAEFLYNGVRFWGRSNHAYQLQHELALIDQTFRNDLESAYVNRFLPGNAVEGKEDELTFWRETSTGLQQRRYRYDPEHQCLFRATGLQGAKPEENTLLSAVREWHFEYWDPETENWSFDWNPDSKTAVPTLVRVTVKTDTGDLGKLVFPIKAEAGEEIE